jgi:hypothetical protein
LTPEVRVNKAITLQKNLLDAVDNSMGERGPSESVSESAAREVIKFLRKKGMPLVILDFPVRGIPDDRNTPTEIGDAIRKYFVLPKGSGRTIDDVFDVVRSLQQNMATVRIFAIPELHELIIRYLSPDQIKDCVENVIDQLKTTQ